MTTAAAGTAQRAWVTAIATSAAITGAVAIALSSVVTALAYRGSAGEAYTPLNHWVSELGDPGQSALAPVFNVGLVVGGLSFAVFMLGLAASMPGRPRFAWGAIGILAGLSGALVGVYPMNHLDIHRTVAAAFFNLGWIAVALASADIELRHDRRFHRLLTHVGALAVVAFVAFLVVVRMDGRLGQAVTNADVRPGVWPSTILEWAVVIGIMTWSFLAGVSWRRSTRRGA
jgi:hypothetical membrane protein